MKEFCAQQEFNYPWEFVTAANWRKYPNEVSTHVVAVDVLRREFDEEHQTLKTERLITCKQPIPKWLQVFVKGAEISYVREISVVDRLNETLTMRSVNLTFAKLLRVYETVIYKPDLKDPLNKTVFLQQAQFSSQTGWGKLQNQIESWGVERFSQNASKGKLGFESILKLGIIENLSTSATNLIDEINIKTLNVLNEINSKSDLLLDEIDQNSVKLLNEIRSCNVFKDVNDLSLDILKEMNVQSGVILNDLTKSSSKVINEVNEMVGSIGDSTNLLDHVNEKTSLILKKIDETKSEISNRVSLETENVFRELNSKTDELLKNLSLESTQATAPDTNPDTSMSFSSKLYSLCSKLTHPFSK